MELNAFPSVVIPREVPASWCNSIQEEICSVIEDQGLPLDSEPIRLKEALDRLIEPKPLIFHLETSSCDSFAPGAPGAPGHWHTQMLHASFLPIDPRAFRQFEFLATCLILLNSQNLQKVYSTIQVSFFSHNNRWIPFNPSFFKLSSEGELFFSQYHQPSLALSLADPSLWMHSQKIHSITLSYLKRTPK